ncbi:MAG: hypothetical protein APF76_06935 [Desulfitibacter sp. BRH_c19]|nr:MAG: hypothetical protein APF76_06935 [Desulfitibacter sp. BRH_c19]
MVKTVDIKNVEWRPHPNPKCVKTYLKPLLTPADDPNLRTALMKIEPGGIIPAHTHETLEFFYFLEGEGIMTKGKVEEKAVPGQGVNVPLGITHGLKNETLYDLVFLSCFAPGNK